tara:strand:- start:1378 stop:1815 length:438 start_codon:yes stop_codon:yes gene_type:complete
MAHFAELDDNNVVLRVVVVGNDCVSSDEHIDGEKWCISFFKGGVWKQTSYNNNFRKQFAGIGYTYDTTKNKFISLQPYASWSLDDNDDWQSPITYPTITTYGNNDPLDKYNIFWDETNLQWKAKDYSNPQNNFNWDTSSLSWVSA